MASTEGLLEQGNERQAITSEVVSNLSPSEQFHMYRTEIIDPELERVIQSIKRLRESKKAPEEEVITPMVRKNVVRDLLSRKPSKTPYPNKEERDTFKAERALESVTIGKRIVDYFQNRAFFNKNVRTNTKYTREGLTAAANFLDYDWRKEKPSVNSQEWFLHGDRMAKIANTFRSGAAIKGLAVVASLGIKIDIDNFQRSDHEERQYSTNYKGSGIEKADARDHEIFSRIGKLPTKQVDAVIDGVLNRYSFIKDIGVFSIKADKLDLGSTLNPDIVTFVELCEKGGLNPEMQTLLDNIQMMVNLGFSITDVVEYFKKNEVNLSDLSLTNILKFNDLLSYSHSEAADDTAKEVANLASCINKTATIVEDMVFRSRDSFKDEDTSSSPDTVKKVTISSSSIKKLMTIIGALNNDPYFVVNNVDLSTLDQFIDLINRGVDCSTLYEGVLRGDSSINTMLIDTPKRINYFRKMYELNTDSRRSADRDYLIFVNSLVRKDITDFRLEYAKDYAFMLANRDQFNMLLNMLGKTFNADLPMSDFLRFDSQNQIIGFNAEAISNYLNREVPDTKTGEKLLRGSIYDSARELFSEENGGMVEYDLHFLSFLINNESLFLYDGAFSRWITKVGSKVLVDPELLNLYSQSGANDTTSLHGFSSIPHLSQDKLLNLIYNMQDVQHVSFEQIATLVENPHVSKYYERIFAKEGTKLLSRAEMKVLMKGGEDIDAKYPDTYLGPKIAKSQRTDLSLYSPFFLDNIGWFAGTDRIKQMHAAGLFIFEEGVSSRVDELFLMNTDVFPGSPHENLVRELYNRVNETNNVAWMEKIVSNLKSYPTTDAKLYYLKASLYKSSDSRFTEQEVVGEVHKRYKRIEGDESKVTEFVANFDTIVNNVIDQIDFDKRVKMMESQAGDEISKLIAIDLRKKYEELEVDPDQLRSFIENWGIEVRKMTDLNPHVLELKRVRRFIENNNNADVA